MGIELDGVKIRALGLCQIRQGIAKEAAGLVRVLRLLSGAGLLEISLASGETGQLISRIDLESLGGVRQGPVGIVLPRQVQIGSGPIEIGFNGYGIELDRPAVAGDSAGVIMISARRVAGIHF